jgi:hypothetical protein
LISYVEYNPVRANIVLTPEAYAWSSYRSRLLGKKNIILDPIQFNVKQEDGGNSKYSAWGTGLKLILGTGLG